VGVSVLISITEIEYYVQVCEESLQEINPVGSVFIFSYTDKTILIGIYWLKD
jgi:hypothetical protein